MLFDGIISGSNEPGSLETLLMAGKIVDFPAPLGPPIIIKSGMDIITLFNQ